MTINDYALKAIEAGTLEAQEQSVEKYLNETFAYIFFDLTIEEKRQMFASVARDICFMNFQADETAGNDMKMNPMPLNEDFGKRVGERIAAENELFASAVENIECQCYAGDPPYCVCTNKERACRWLSGRESSERHFTDDQRSDVVADANWLAEGALNREELEVMSDADLGSAWLEAARDYAQSQY